ncbi:MAG: hypothetical protein KAR36_05745 [Candidatus Latescibacteria bacterium]|nr:hypothetical protein [Candidatus Latescibacterota bacterium]
MTYLSDMSQCKPASALSEKQEKGHWTLIPYETEEVSGTFVSALSFITAPELTLPLGISGWYSIYVGYWNPYFAYDNGTIIKFRLSGDAAFCRVREPEICVSQTETALQEVFFKHADLTGQDFVIGKVNGQSAQKALVAYVKLVPLGEAEVAEIQRDRAHTDTKKLVATIDGMFFWGNEYKTREHIMEQVECYRDSDVGKVLWAVNYGETTNYPSEVGTFWPDHSRAQLVEGPGSTPYILGQKGAYNTFLDMISSKGIVPQEVVSKHVHEMGLKFDIMFRLGIGGGLPPHRDEDGMVARYPEFRQVMRDGTAVEKASYAFEEVRAFMLAMIREAVNRFDVDGINLCFVRGPHFVTYEQPVLDRFQALYGEDAREVDPSDPRLHAVRAELMGAFVRGARRILDEIGQEKGKHLALSIWAWPSGKDVWCGETPMAEGLDFRSWIEEGLLDSFICQEGVDPEDLACCKKHGCDFVLFPGYREPTPTTPKTVAEGWEKGVDQIAIWDIDPDEPSGWEWIRRIGHREEMAAWDEHGSRRRRIPLLKVGGFDVAEGLQASVYSGG